jgi:protein-tyrosine phosphatase
MTGTEAAVVGSGASPSRPFQILVVCTGNICRSPMVEHLLRDALTAEPSSPAAAFEVGSAGVRGWDGAPMDPPAAAELRRLGGDPSGFRGRSFSAALGGRADLILTATADHRRLVLQEVPQALRRTFTVLEFAHLVSAVDGVAGAAGSPSELVSRAAAQRGAARIDAYDLGDPYGRSADVHRRTADLAKAAVATISSALLCLE